MMLFTRQNLEKAQLIEYNNATSILESNYNASLDTKLIIHGFGSSCHRVWAREMRLSFLAVVSSSKKDFVYCLNKTGSDRFYLLMHTLISLINMEPTLTDFKKFHPPHLLKS